MTTKRMSLKVSEDLYNWVNKEAEERVLTMNAVIIFALETYRKEREILPQISNMQAMLEQLQEDNS